MGKMVYLGLREFHTILIYLSFMQIKSPRDLCTLVWRRKRCVAVSWIVHKGVHTLRTTLKSQALHFTTFLNLRVFCVSDFRLDNQVLVGGDDFVRFFFRTKINRLQLRFDLDRRDYRHSTNAQTITAQKSRSITVKYAFKIMSFLFASWRFAWTEYVHSFVAVISCH